ncbi:hypothetical protein OT109_14500 [Phycisphaeraceae bacterium D3-23]
MFSSLREMVCFRVLLDLFLGSFVMSDVIRVDGDFRSSNVVPVLPEAQVAMRVRAGKLTDFEFIDALQKQNQRGLGFMYESAIKGHIGKGNVLVAELGAEGPSGGAQDTPTAQHSAPGPLDPSAPSPATPVGYIIATDRYMKRDELGIIYHLCVAPGVRRSLVAANLLKARFESSAYGCRLYCCWCAQDLSANRFWEAMGFVPLAFRTGSRKSGWKDEAGVKHTGPRMHIYWQKRIREGDEGDLASGGTSYWFPSQTGGGAMAEDRLVLPIPPGTHWSDAKPVLLPSGPISEGRDAEVKLLESEVSRLEREKRAAGRVSKRKAAAVALPRHAIESGGLRFAPPPPPEGGEGSEQTSGGKEEVEAALKEAKRAVKKAKRKFDPAQEAFARELKDRWLEEVLARPGLLAQGAEKYAVRRRIESSMKHEPAVEEIRRLDAA